MIIIAKPSAIKIPPPITPPIPIGPCKDASIPKPFIKQPIIIMRKPSNLKNTFIKEV
jgi:hypothetical protein